MARFSKVPKAFRSRKAIRKTPACLFCKAGLLICCKGNKHKNNCKVSCLETPSFWRYKENCVTRNAPEKFRDFRETGSCSQKFISGWLAHFAFMVWLISRGQNWDFNLGPRQKPTLLGSFHDRFRRVCCCVWELALRFWSVFFCFWLCVKDVARWRQAKHDSYWSG